MAALYHNYCCLRGVTEYSKYIGNYFCRGLRARFQNAKEAYSSQLASITKAILGLLGSAVMGLGYSYRDKSIHLHFPVV